jgi:hypothetical protein
MITAIKVCWVDLAVAKALSSMLEESPHLASLIFHHYLRTLVGLIIPSLIAFIDIETD